MSASFTVVSGSDCFEPPPSSNTNAHHQIPDSRRAPTMSDPIYVMAGQANTQQQQQPQYVVCQQPSNFCAEPQQQQQQQPQFVFCQQPGNVGVASANEPQQQQPPQQQFVVLSSAPASQDTPTGGWQPQQPQQQPQVLQPPVFVSGGDGGQSQPQQQPQQQIVIIMPQQPTTDQQQLQPQPQPQPQVFTATAVPSNSAGGGFKTLSQGAGAVLLPQQRPQPPQQQPQNKAANAVPPFSGVPSFPTPPPPPYVGPNTPTPSGMTGSNRSTPGSSMPPPPPYSTNTMGGYTPTPSSANSTPGARHLGGKGKGTPRAGRGHQHQHHRANSSRGTTGSVSLAESPPGLTRQNTGVTTATTTTDQFGVVGLTAGESGAFSAIDLADADNPSMGSGAFTINSFEGELSLTDYNAATGGGNTSPPSLGMVAGGGGTMPLTPPLDPAAINMVNELRTELTDRGVRARVLRLPVPLCMSMVTVLDQTPGLMMELCVKERGNIMSHLLERLGGDAASALVSFAYKNFMELSLNQSGCIALPRILTYVTPAQRNIFYHRTIDHFDELITHPFGNYVVKHFLESPEKDHFSGVVRRLMQDEKREGEDQPLLAPSSKSVPGKGEGSSDDDDDEDDDAHPPLMQTELTNTFSEASAAFELGQENSLSFAPEATTEQLEIKSAPQPAPAERQQQQPVEQKGKGSEGEGQKEEGRSILFRVCTNKFGSHVVDDAFKRCTDDGAKPLVVYIFSNKKLLQALCSDSYANYNIQAAFKYVNCVLRDVELQVWCISQTVPLVLSSPYQQNIIKHAMMQPGTSTGTGKQAHAHSHPHPHQSNSSSGGIGAPTVGTVSSSGSSNFAGGNVVPSNF